MGFLTPFFYEFITNPLSALLLIAGWQLAVLVIDLAFSRFNNPIVNGLLSTSIMAGGGLAGQMSKQDWSGPKRSYDHLNNPMFVLARKIGITITFIIIALVIGILFSSIFTLVVSITETIMMFGTFGIILVVLFWSSVGIFISNLFR